MKTYGDCKKQVAEKHGYPAGAIESIEKSKPELFSVINEAAELYMRHAANEAVKEYKIFSLPSQQSFIFGHITNDFKSTGEISQNTGLLSKNVSVQLHNILSVGGLIEMKQEGKLKYWKLL